MAFFHTESLVQLSMKTGLLPWDFRLTERITPEMRSSKPARQAWYQNTKTRHYFYTGLEPLNPNQRISDSNPPARLHVFVADFDVPIPDSRVPEIVASFPIKPSYTERSLGGNLRVVWILAAPMGLWGKDFAIFVLTKAKKWLNLDLAPGLDEPAWTELTRLYCNGCEWKATGHSPIPEDKSHSFLVECVKEFGFVGAKDGIDIPFEEIEKALKVKYPAFDWPDEFKVDSQGPTFWVPESTSPKSAIVKQYGMFTFSAHAPKNFFTWGDLLGAEFVEDYQTVTITKATKNIAFDGHSYFMQVPGLGYQARNERSLETFFKTRCNLTSKPDRPGGKSEIDEAKQFIADNNSVVAAVPVIFQKAGFLEMNGERILNLYNRKPMEPAAGTQKWGPHGDAPMLTSWSEALLKIHPQQLDRWLAWAQRCYQAAYFWEKMAHPYSFLQGGPGVGKTLFHREVLGTLVGGYMDASNFLVEGGHFNGHLLRCPFWALDDDAPGSNSEKHDRFISALKKIVAQGGLVYSEKFQKGTSTEFFGIVGITLNMDYISARVIGSVDSAMLDRVNMFRCVETKEQLGFEIPSRKTISEQLIKELPVFGRLLLDNKVPDYLVRDTRWGYYGWQHPDMLTQVRQTSNTAPFKEVLWAGLKTFFNDNDTDRWVGNSRALQQMISMDLGNEIALRRFDIRQINRYMDEVERSKVLPMTADNGPLDTRVWTIHREPYFSKPVTELISSPPVPENSPKFNA